MQSKEKNFASFFSSSGLAPPTNSPHALSQSALNPRTAAIPELPETQRGGNVIDKTVLLLDNPQQTALSLIPPRMLYCVSGL